MSKNKSKKSLSTRKEVQRLLLSGRHQYWKKLNNDLLEQVIDNFQNWPQSYSPYSKSELSENGYKVLQLIHFIKHEVGQIQQTLKNMKNQYEEYSQLYSKAVSKQEKYSHILNYASLLGATRKQIRGDKQAFSRWFGHDALSDRYHRRHLETERYLSFVLQCLGQMLALFINKDGENIGYHRFWQRLALEPLIKPLLNYEGDNRVVVSAFHALTEALSAMPAELQHHCMSESSLRFIYHACLSNKQSVWVQCEALQLLQTVAPDSLSIVLSKRLEHPTADDDLFVRRKVVEIIGQQLSTDLSFEKLIKLALKDPSPSVRQKIAPALNLVKPEMIAQFYPVLLEDSVEQVRASTLLNLTLLMTRSDCLSLSLSYLTDSLQKQQQNFPLRVALKVCCDGLKDRTDKHSYINSLLPAVETLHQTAKSFAVRRWAAQTREFLWCFANDKNSQKINSLQHFISTIPPGKTRRIPKDLQLENDDHFARILAVLAQQDFGFDVEKGMFGSFITRGHAFGFRLWRLLHEFRHPSPDKRQAFQHTRGRLFWGTLRIPSAILSELAETKVPGEPLYMDGEDGWRGYLPLVDEVISALAVGHQPTRFYHSEGITRLQPPKYFWQRWVASWRISYHFSHFASLRNWKEQSQDSPKTYIEALNALAIQVNFRGHTSELDEISEDPAVLRFFPLTIPLTEIQRWQDFKEYFISVYENTLYELSAFLAVAIAYFIYRHLYLYRQIKKARNNLPLVLGGWGTRGKSGTERIKAALINALGYSIISKTTGCEAMFIHAHPYGELKEMFLFRPYDKATIWEQHNLVCLADKLNCEVFLWECMGLTPSYIDILQRQWMRDDIATITNTYPDHEDLQGPAGINIPEVMTQFIPEKSTLITSEEQMLPILRMAAQQRNTRFRSISWLEAGLLAEDVLERFPYDEHPFNIALVMAMADELGVDGDYAIKEMADRVVADIGVLKTFPCAPWRSRRLEFVNGMSANERFGCLGNWQRMGFDKLRSDEQIDTWITCVINNRADRIARSRVFASIIVKDLSFDRCVLIGNNLNGLLSYIKESWAEWIESITLESDDEKPEDILLRMAERFRIPYNKKTLHLRLQAMLQGQKDELDVTEFIDFIEQPEQLEKKMLADEISNHQEILQFFQQDQSLMNSYDDFLSKLQQSGSVTYKLQQQFKELLWQWLEQKIILNEDYYSTGNQVIEKICDVTPPGFYNRIIGMQNIKGTGLDFVYRWQAWESCYNACEQLLSTSISESSKGLTALTSFQEFGYLAKETVVNTIEKVKLSPLAQNERYQAELELILTNLGQSLNQLESNTSSGSSNSWINKLSQKIESFLDLGDAVKRRKKADLIYKDLVNERISHDRAALELQAINKRQKGGWFNFVKP